MPLGQIARRQCIAWERGGAPTFAYHLRLLSLEIYLCLLSDTLILLEARTNRIHISGKHHRLPACTDSRTTQGASKLQPRRNTTHDRTPTTGSRFAHRASLPGTTGVNVSRRLPALTFSSLIGTPSTVTIIPIATVSVADWRRFRATPAF